MGIPVNRLKIMAFSFGAGIAGLAGGIFAAVQTGAFPQNFGTAVLILIYAVVILGGTGSLIRDDRRCDRDHRVEPGARLDLVAEPCRASSSTSSLIVAVLLTMKTWPKRIAALGGHGRLRPDGPRDRRSAWTNGTTGQVDLRWLPRRT